MKKRTVPRLLCFLAAIGLVAGACTIPFVFESRTLYYKFGMEKTLLRAAKMAGLIAFVMLLYQPFFVARFSFADRIFGLDRLYMYHKRNAVFLLLPAILHPVLILASEGFTLFPFEIRYWPEFLGIALLIVLVVTVSTAFFRSRLRMNWNVWAVLHKMLTILIFVMGFVHVKFVSSSFEGGMPTYCLYAAGVAVFFMLIAIFVRRSVLLSKKWDVVSVRQAGRDACAVEIAIPEDEKRHRFPGQFIFAAFLSPELPVEEHPFTIASSPGNPDALQLVIRAAGDYTDRIHRLSPGARVCLDGPFGQFSHIFLNENTPVFMVAGGIGITPMLSMLRYMRETGDQRRTVLLWSNRTPEHVIFPDEFETLCRDLPNLEIVHRFTRQANGNDCSGRIDPALVRSILSGFEAKAAVFLCGPPGMARRVKGYVKQTGFSTAGVYTEQFVL